MSRFAGVPPDATDFYRELEANNTREWWAANKERYEHSVREPFLALIDALTDEFGEARVFRPFRDLRFSADKSPYKTEQGAVVAGKDGAGYYLRIGSDGLTTGGGYIHAAPDQVTRYRGAVDAETSGRDLVGIVTTLRRKGFQIGGETLTGRPKGYAPDHPRIGLLRHKSLIAWREHGIPAWLPTSSVVRHVRDDWRSIRPLAEWLTSNVGATTMARPERFGR
ncbi:MAG: DUF2461 domain-containing protein [Actinomycetota bacterium]|nr:DUF2461 domain-containing protein [Actinomycetota bacterium]